MSGERATPRDEQITLESFEGEPDSTGVERDGVASLHDTEAEAGDEVGLRDRFTLDRKEAHELGVDLDPSDGLESELD